MCNFTVLFPQTAVSRNIIIFLALDFIMAVLTIAGNSIFMLTLIKTRELHTPSNMLLGALCLSDLLVGFIVHPMFITFYFKAQLQRTHDEVTEKMIFTAQHICTGLSFLFGVIVSLDRYAAICHPYRYHALAKCKTHLWIAVLTGMTWTLIPVIDRFIDEPLFLAVSTSGGVLIGISLILFSYYRIYSVIRTQKRQVHTLGRIETARVKVQTQDGAQIFGRDKITPGTVQRGDKTNGSEPMKATIGTYQRQNGTQTLGINKKTSGTAQKSDATNGHEPIETTIVTLHRHDEIRGTIEATVAAVQIQNMTRKHEAIETRTCAVQSADETNRCEKTEAIFVTEYRQDVSLIRGNNEVTAETVQRRDESDTRGIIKATAGTVQVRNQTHTHGSTETAVDTVHRQNGTQISRMTEATVGPAQRRIIAYTHGATETASGTFKSQEKTRRKRERDRTRMILLILLCQLVCFAPYFGLTIYFMATSTICLDTPTKLISDLWASFILLVNSCINPLIYCWKCENIKNTALRHLCGNRRDEKQSSNTRQSATGERSQQMEACR